MAKKCNKARSNMVIIVSSRLIMKSTNPDTCHLIGQNYSEINRNKLLHLALDLTFLLLLGHGFVLTADNERISGIDASDKHQTAPAHNSWGKECTSVITNCVRFSASIT
jgi:hypothetical protein